MPRVRVPLIALLTMVIIGACSKHDPVANVAKPVNLALPANDARPDPAGGPPENETEPAAAVPHATPAVTIPARLQGRWALAPGDCGSRPGDSRGLLVVRADGLTFAESHAVPSPGVQTDAGTTSGQFHFTGQGRAWTKFESLKRRGDKLTRTETNPAASYTYAKC